MKTLARICVFCGSSSGRRPAYAEAARELGALLASRDIELVYGGGCTGLMGAVADGALAACGRVVGVIPKALVTKELAHAGLSEQHIVESMHERKALMAKLADAFIALPGGFGTLEEFCEVLTWSQLGLHVKPCALLNVEGYFQPLIELFEHTVEEGFVNESHRALVVNSNNAAELLETLQRWEAPEIQRWWVNPDTV
jgi:uncharacterized protein (TIGR00730 family)